MRAGGGFTLIEVLIAFVILSIGLLGIVSLQALSKVSQHQSMQRTRAVTVADDLLERIRANPQGMTTYTAGSVVYGGSTLSAPAANCNTASCTTVELATHDLWEFEQALDGAGETVVSGGATRSVGGLVQPQACIVFTPDSGKTNTGILNIIVQWRGLEETTDAVVAGGRTCGGASAGNDRSRRQVIVSSYIVDAGDL
ncbi:hypothetical protein GCM10027297_18720 [Parahaliea aestuarii]